MGRGAKIGPARPHPQPLPERLKRSDRSWGWEAAALAQVGWATGLGGGIFVFNFRSYAAWNLAETFLFVAGGAGLGGSLGGASLPDFDRKRIAYSPLTVRRAFSANDLNGAAGFLAAGGVSVAAGYTVMSISAFDRAGVLFDPSDCSGWSAGFSLQVYGMAGYWRMLSAGAEAANEMLRRR